MCLFLCGAWSLAGEKIPPIPEDLIDDEHVREELGVNVFTAPSIKKLFQDLDELGNIPYARLSRKIPENLPKDRAMVAVSLGMLISDGLVSVQCEKVGDLEPIGRALLNHAKLLGAGKRMNRHTKSLIECSVSGDWDKLKNELAATQADVEAELVLLRDVDIAHLISLGGWLRAFQMGCETVTDPFSPERAVKIARKDIAGYFAAQLATMDMDVLSTEKMKALRDGVIALETSLDIPDPKAVNLKRVNSWKKLTSKLLAELLEPGAVARETKK